jgi:uncharacterized protein YvpB
MKLNVPFYNQTTNLNCGPTALKMVLSYFGKNKDLKEIEEKCEIKEGKGIYTIQIATAASRFGYETNFYSKHLGVNPENLKMDFYKKYSEEFDDSGKIVINAKNEGVKIHEMTLNLEEILGFVSEKSVPIILLDWNVVRNQKEKGYQGHFVPIVGYDETNVYIHNHGLTNPKKFLKIKKEIFEEARKAKGTDEDILIIFDKPKTL